jgi:glutaminase
MNQIQQQLDKLHNGIKQESSALTKTAQIRLMNANADWLALAVITVGGEAYAVGDHDQLFPIQSMSKPFTYGLALEDYGHEHLLAHVGVEPTGRSYSAIVLDEKTGRPLNPMVNAGAIAIASLLKGADLTEKTNRVIATLSRYAGRPLLVDAATLTAEFQTGDRNRAIAHLMRSFGGVQSGLEDALHLYFQQCSMMVNVVDLAAMAATLANEGVHPITHERAIQKDFVRDVLSVMYTCGMYDSSGEWSYRVGLPGKSGVSGGIFAVAPGKMGVAAFAPHLNANGHSVLALKALERLSRENDLHIFNFS